MALKKYLYVAFQKYIKKMNPLLPKICIIGICLGKGGAERSVAILSQMLHGKGYDVHVAILTNKIDYNFSGKLYNLGAEKEKLNRPWDRFIRFKRFKEYLKEQKIDFVIDQRPKNNYYRELFYAHYVYSGMKRIYVVQNSKLTTYFSTSVQKMIGLYKSTLFTVGVSNYIYENLLKKQGILNSYCIHNTFAKGIDKSNASLPIQFQNIEKFVLFFGRIDDAHKNIRFLLNSFTISNLWKNNVHLVIMGDGPDKTELINTAKQLESNSKIVFLPFLNEPFSIVKNARTVALTSNHEGFPLVLVETLAVGTPVVSLDFVSGPSEVIQQGINGLLVKDRCEKEFANALIEMCTNEKLYATCKANAKSSVSLFSTEEIANKWDNLLRSFSKKRE